MYGLVIDSIAILWPDEINAALSPHFRLNPLFAFFICDGYIHVLVYYTTNDVGEIPSKYTYSRELFFQ